MSSQGPNAPGTTADDATVGSVTWGTTDNAKVSDNAYATAALPSLATSHYLKVTNFGFSIPAGSTINGITVEVERSKTGLSGMIVDSHVFIVKGGTIGGTEHSNASAWPTTDTFQTYGSGSDLWGLAWVVADINASNFGFVISITNSDSFSGTGQVDFIRITITYTAAVTTVPERTKMGVGL